MIVKIENKIELLKLKNILEQDITKNIYFYLDIIKYGIENKNVEFWKVMNSKSEIIAGIMIYYNSIQLFNTDNINKSEVEYFLKANNHKMISGEKSLIEALTSETSNYKITVGKTCLFNKYKEIKHSKNIIKANKNDAKEIAKLILSDDKFTGNYEVENLTKQIEDRISSNMGRSYVIKENDKIIAHIATFAEIDGIAITSGLIVDKNYRKQEPLGYILESYLVNRLQEEGFKVYTQIKDKKRYKLLKVLGTIFCNDYANLTLKG